MESLFVFGALASAVASLLTTLVARWRINQRVQQLKDARRAQYENHLVRAERALKQDLPRAAILLGAIELEARLASSVEQALDPTEQQRSASLLASKSAATRLQVLRKLRALEESDAADVEHLLRVRNSAAHDTTAEPSPESARQYLDLLRQVLTRLSVSDAPPRVL